MRFGGPLTSGIAGRNCMQNLIFLFLPLLNDNFHGILLCVLTYQASTGEQVLFHDRHLPNKIVSLIFLFFLKDWSDDINSVMHGRIYNGMVFFGGEGVTLILSTERVFNLPVWWLSN